MRLTKHERRSIRLVVEAYLIQRTGLYPSMGNKMMKLGVLGMKGKVKPGEGYKDPEWLEFSKLEWTFVGDSIKEAIPDADDRQAYFNFIGCGAIKIFSKRRRREKIVLPKPIIFIEHCRHISRSQAYVILDKWEFDIEQNLNRRRSICKEIIREYLKAFLPTKEKECTLKARFTACASIQIHNPTPINQYKETMYSCGRGTFSVLPASLVPKLCLRGCKSAIERQAPLISQPPDNQLVKHRLSPEKQKEREIEILSHFSSNRSVRKASDDLHISRVIVRRVLAENGIKYDKRDQVVSE